MENSKNITQVDCDMRKSGVFWSQYLICINIEINVQISFHSSNISCGYLLNAANRAVKKMDGHSRPHGFIFGDFDWKQ